jgi:biotin-dependent carboxylase-like uncharacterized protein
MGVTILTPGLQTIIVASPRAGLRHLGVPGAGAADALSFALANRLVANRPGAGAFEIPLSQFSVRFAQDAAFAVTGAEGEIDREGEPVTPHTCHRIAAGQSLTLGPAQAGARRYLALSGGVIGTEVLGAITTYLPAGLGGHLGRALKAGDVIPIGTQNPSQAEIGLKTPLALRPRFGAEMALRASPGAEFDMLSAASRNALFADAFTVSRRADRMGLGLEAALRFDGSDPVARGRMASAPVLPGTMQGPPDGAPFLLMADAQTTGGYPRLLQVIEADLYLIGQLRPGARVRFLRRTPEDGLADTRARTALLAEWLG